MTGIHRRLPAVWLAAVVFAAACADPGAGIDPLAGASVTGLRVTDLAGVNASIDAFRGRVLLLNVWATWCGPCRKELPSLDRLSTRLDATRFVVAGVAVDGDHVAVSEYLRQNAIRFPNLVAVDRREIQLALGVRTLPQTLIFAADGSLIERIEGARNWDSAAVRARIEAAAVYGLDPATGLPRAAADGLSWVSSAPRAAAGAYRVAEPARSPVLEITRAPG